MKKVRIIILFMTLLLGMFLFMPAGVFAYTYNPDKDGEDFTPYKNDIYSCDLVQNDIYVRVDGTVLVFIRSGLYKHFQFRKETDFSSVFLPYLFPPGDAPLLKDVFNVNKIYWNPWLEIWQLEYPVEPNITAVDWINHISQFDFGFAYSEIDDSGDILIVEEPSHEFDGWFIDYDFNNGDIQYFEPELDDIEMLVRDDEGVVWYLEQYFEDYDGYLYWNFEEQYWQVEYYGTTELDYYKQRVDELEDEISLLENEISSLEDEISSLEDEISSLEDEISLLENEIQDLENEISLLEDEIQRLEDENSLLEDEISSLEDEISLLEDEIQRLEEALDLEYDRGYNDGYEIGYSEGLLVENNDINIIKWFVPLVVIIIIVGIIEPIMLFKRRG